MDNDVSYRKDIFWDDTVLNHITKNFISLKEHDIKNNNQHLRKILIDGLIPLMKSDDLFKDTYQNINYSGSFFKGTKVGKPDEYDLDLVIKLPLNYNILQIETNHSHYGYIKIKVADSDKLPKWQTHSEILDKWLDNKGYLSQNKFRQWIEKIMTNTYKQLEKVNNNYEITVNNETYILKPFKKSGPAFTIYIQLKDGTKDSHVMSIDFVPSLAFKDKTLNDYRILPDTTQNFQVVPKPSEVAENSILWRLSFYEQEKQFLLNSNIGQIKTVIRLLKKFRDQLQWKFLASYYIETLCFHEIIHRKSDKLFFKSPVTCLFMHMMGKLKEAISLQRLEYFWNKNLNLFSKLSYVESFNYTHRLNKIIIDIHNKIKCNRFIIAEQLVSKSDLIKLRELVCAPNKLDTKKIEAKEDMKVLEEKETQKEDLTDSVVRPINIDARIDQICNDLHNISKIQQDLSDEQLDKLHEACSNLLKVKKSKED